MNINLGKVSELKNVGSKRVVRYTGEMIKLVKTLSTVYNLSYKAIAIYLNSEGYTRADGKAFKYDTVRYIIKL